MVTLSHIVHYFILLIHRQYSEEDCVYRLSPAEDGTNSAREESHLPRGEFEALPYEEWE